MRDREIDIVHAHDYKTDLLAWLLARDGVIAAVHRARLDGTQLRASSWLYYPLDKRLLAHFPRGVAVSSDVRRELIERGAVRIAP